MKPTLPRDALRVAIQRSQRKRQKCNLHLDTDLVAWAKERDLNLSALVRDLLRMAMDADQESSKS